MKAHFIFLLTALLGVHLMPAQDLLNQWAWQTGSNLDDRIQAIAEDANGNLYVAGYVRNEAQLNPLIGASDGSIPANGVATTGYIAKYNSAGAFVTLYQIRHTSTLSDAFVYCQDLEVRGDTLVVVGEFTESTGTPGDAEVAQSGFLWNSNGARDQFVMLLDLDLNHLSSRPGGAAENDYIKDVEVDNDGNLWTTFTTDYPGNASRTVHLRKYNASNFPTDPSILINAEIGDAPTDAPSFVETSEDGYVYIGGVYSVNADLDLNGSLESPTSTDKFYLIKLATNGLVEHFVTWGDDTGNNEQMNDLILDHAGNLVVAATYTDPTDWDPDPSTTALHVPSSGTDVMVAKFDSDLNLLWTQPFFGGNGENELGRALAVDACNRIYFSASFEGYFGDGNQILTNADPGSMDIAIASIDDASGMPEVVQLTRFGGAENDVCLALHGTLANQEVNVLMGGFVDAANVFNSDLANLNNLALGDEDLFFARYTLSGSSNELNGCTDVLACNYAPKAQFDDGSCSYPDADLDGVLDCFDNCPCNFNPAQLNTVNDCVNSTTGDACTDSDNDGFTDSVEIASGSDPLNNNDTPCPLDSTCFGDLTLDGEITTGDVLALLGVFGSVCD